MAEERLVDDDYGRGVKLRKTKDGYVDATDELAPPVDEESEEVSFAYPMEETEEDDEDLVGLSPEEAKKLRQQKIEAAKKRKEEYDAAVAEGNDALENGRFAEAEKIFERALLLDEIATQASVGYWRAKTENFEKPEVLIEEYVEPGIESLEYDLGYEAADIIKKEYRHVFQDRYDRLAEEEKPLAEEVEGKQERRRAILKGRRKNGILGCVISALPLLVFGILTAVFALKINTTPDNRYVPYTIGFGAAALVAFIVFALLTNKMINVFRIYAKNERLTATEEGERLFDVRERKDLYAALLREEQADFSEEETEE